MRLQVRGRAPPARRRNAVNQQTGSHEIEQRVGFVQQRAAVAGMNQRHACSRRRQLAEQPFKLFSLRGRKCRVVFHRGIMRVEALDPDSRKPPRPNNQLTRFVRRNTEPAHACVHLDVDAHFLVQFDRGA